MKFRYTLALIAYLAFSSCTDETRLKPTLTQSDLNEIIKNEKMKSHPGEKIMSLIISKITTKYNMIVVDENTPTYQEKYQEFSNMNSAKVAECDFTMTLLTGVGGEYSCWVFVIEYGECGDNTGCIGNMWLCEEGDNLQEVTIC